MTLESSVLALLRVMERDLQEYLRFYNFDRTHRGYRLRGRTPAVLFCHR